MKELEPSVLNYFMFRLPSKGFNGLNDLYDLELSNISKKEIISTLVKDENLLTAIKTASPNLYLSVMNLNSKNDKDLEQIYYSVLKYFIRMFSRPTPFSTFSSVGMGTFNTHASNEIKFNSDLHEVYLRVSHEWLYKYISKIESDSTVFKYLELKSNVLISNHSDKLHLSYFSDGGTKSKLDFEEISLTRSNLIIYLINNFKEGRKVSEIVDEIISNNNDVTDTQIIKYIQDLVKKDFLISNLRISTSIEDPISHLLSILNGLGTIGLPYFKELRSIQQNIKQVNKDSFNSVLINKLEENMKKIIESSEYLHVDMFHNESKFLSTHIQKDISKLAKILIQISTLLDKGNEHMDFYFKKFINTYGTFNAVSIKDLLEDKTELGSPPTYSNPISLLDFEYSSITNNQSKSNNFLKTLIYKSLIENKTEIDVRDYLENNATKLELIPEGSLDLYVSINASSRKDLNNGDYKIYPSGNVISPFAGKTMGRFLDMFPEHKNKVQFSINEKEKEIFKKDLLTNINICPLKGKASNVMHAPNYFESEISISSNNNPQKTPIELDDVYIYTDGEKFHLISKSLNKSIVPLSSHMVNPQFGMPNIYRFLMEVSSYNRLAIVPFNWGEYEDLPFLPRVIYENIVINPKAWTIKWDKNKKKSKDLDQYIKEFFIKYNVSRYIKCIDFDNYIFIDTHSKLMMDLFKKELIKKKGIKFVEADEMDECSALVDEQCGNYINEFIFSAFHETNKKENTQIPDYLTFYNKENRLSPLGSEWIYVKIYHPLNYEFNILVGYINKFVEDNFNETPMYFIRYNDPNPHIRLRIKVNENNKSLVLEKLYTLNTFLQRDKLITNFIYDTYNKEVERYGGISLIENAETIFCYDSKINLKLLPFNKHKEIDIEDFALISLERFLKMFIKNTPVHVWLEDKILIEKKYYKDFRVKYKNRKKVVNDLVMPQYMNISNEDLQKLQNQVDLYIVEFFKCNISENSENYYNQIVLSFIHMHLNRYGIHSEDEKRMMHFLYFKQKEEYMRNEKEVDTGAGEKIYS